MKPLYPKPKSICILRLSAIGDVCNAIATVQELQQHWPVAEITWVIGKIEYQIVKQLPGIHFVIFDKSQGIRSFTQLHDDLKLHHFDILLHMQLALRASIASRCISAKHRWGFHKDNCKELQWLFTNHKIQALKQPHVAEGFWAFAQALVSHYKQDCNTPIASKPHWHISIDDDDQTWVEQHINKETFVISPAASKASRNWLVERYAAVADHAIAKGYQVILTGSPSDVDVQLSQSIIDHCKPENLILILDLTGKTTLLQLLTILKNAQLVLAPDSGPAHMASMVNTAVIGLYAHSNPDRTGPYHSRENTISIYKELVESQSVKTIEELPWGTRFKGDHLMANISTESVIKQFDKMSALNTVTTNQHKATT